ncbi:MAG TPA: hypothetical protein VHS55_03505 [Solirubrobacteraceae bacterium]|nr:hypothetical protein [Solirubrobacteraceae bacterium]
MLAKEYIDRALALHRELAEPCVVSQGVYESAIDGAEAAFRELVEATEQRIEDCSSELIVAHG